MADFDDFFGDLMEPVEPEVPTAVEAAAPTPAAAAATTTPQASAAQTPPPPATDEKEVEADFVTPRETSSPKPPLPEQAIPPQKAAEVDAVASSELVLALTKDGDMDAASTQKCREVMGHAPMDLMDPNVQKQLIKRNPALESAFRNPLTKGFAIGVNQASTTLCKSILLIVIARALLENTLAAMSLSCQNRSTLVAMALEVQQSMNMIAQKAQSFVMLMATTIREMGETALALEYEADPQMLVQAVEESNSVVVQQVQDLQDDEKKAQSAIEEGMAMILGNLQKESAYTIQEAIVKEKRKAYDEAEKKLHDAYNTQYTEQTTLMARDKFLEGEVVSLEAAKASKEEAENQQGDELKEMERLKMDYVGKKDALQQESFDESKVPGLENVPELMARLKRGELDMTRYTDLTRGQEDLRQLQAAANDVQAPTAAAPNMEFKREFQKMVQNEVAARQRVLDARIARLEGVEKQTEKDAQAFREQSRLASDGYTTRDTGSFLSLWNQTSAGRKNTICGDCNGACHIGCNASSTNGCYVMRSGRCTKCGHPENRHVLGVLRQTTTSEKTGTNERERLQRMAADLDQTLAGIRNELTHLRTQRGGIMLQVKKDMAHVKNEQAADERQTQQRAQERAAFINKQNQKALDRAAQTNARIQRENTALLGEMNAKNEEIMRRNRTVLESARSRNEQLTTHARTMFYDNQQKGMDMLDKQIGSIQIMITAVSKRKEGFGEEVRNLANQISEYVQEREGIERTLDSYKTEHAGKIEELTKLEKAEAAAKEEYEAESKKLKDLVKRFGIQSGEDFAAFMQMFNLLGKSVKDLPMAMQNLSASFDHARETFSGDFFQKSLKKIPERNHGRVMQRVAVDMQSICEVGWNMFSAPINGLIDTEARALLEPLMKIEMDRRAVTLGDDTNPIIEEVDE